MAKKGNIPWNKGKTYHNYDSNIILEKLRNIAKIKGGLTVTEISYLYKIEDVPSGCTLTKMFGSISNLFKIGNIQTKKPVWRSRLGKNESKILDKIEYNSGIKLLRQFCVGRKYVDGYDPINNIVYEVDEFYHKYYKQYDSRKESIIKNILGCEVIRIIDEEVL